MVSFGPLFAQTEPGDAGERDRQPLLDLYLRSLLFDEQRGPVDGRHELSARILRMVLHRWEAEQGHLT